MRDSPPVDNAKYIYVARNTYDCAVSYYHFPKGLTPKTVTDVSFESYLPFFLSAKHRAALSEAEVILQKVLNARSLGNMKVFFSDKPVNRVTKLVETASKKPASFEMLKNLLTEAVETHKAAGFVRKENMGD
ncbi:hypothetical protein HPB49_020233 [Dermacentor silvarum]|uniref:Uncharacterized protein n=1 Tax=Dermacentor silvarum TaxID=543639 RepID=A0ACB8CH84_DERSI|nr:hypothetical protein HPB49_020233 [Dermacentor silvarum]